MSKNHGRRFFVRGTETRNLETKSALYDAFAELTFSGNTIINTKGGISVASGGEARP